MTPAQAIDIAGWNSKLACWGRRMQPDTGEPSFLAIVSDRQELIEPSPIPKAKKRVYATIQSLADVVADPRKINRLDELDTDGTVLRSLYGITFDETVGDNVTWVWFCESTRSKVS